MKTRLKNMSDYNIRMNLDDDDWEQKLEALKAINLEDLPISGKDQQDLELKIEYGRISFAICISDGRAAPNGFSLSIEDLNRLDTKELVNLVKERIVKDFGEVANPDETENQ